MADRDNVLTAAARMSFGAAEHGDFRGFDQLLPRLRAGETVEMRAWDVALRAIRASFDPTRQRPPSLAEARAVPTGEASAAAIVANACAVMERLAARTFDRASLSEWLALHASLGAATDPGSDSISLRAGRLWERLFAGDTERLDAEAKEVFDEASRRSAGAEVVEATVVRALVALSAGALNDAIDLGRRASRMAQSESLPQQEYLANVTLARVRRYSGRPHLALHILAALGRVAPPSWSGWIGWETLLAGGKRRAVAGAGDGESDLRPSQVAEGALGDLLDAARTGERPAFDTAAARLVTAAAVWPHLGEEAAALLAALDPTRRPAPDKMVAWQRGETPLIPFGLHGVGIPQSVEPQTETATAYVLAAPGSPGRRLLFPGLPLVHGARMLGRDAAKSGARTETGIAALALSSEPATSRDGFFRSVYGFPFVAHRHRAVLDVLCHRMRALLGTAGEIRREGAEAGAATSSPREAPVGPTLILTLHEPIVVADMRCVLPTADRVLRALATMGATSASAAAESLRMPLRTVQAVLQQLVSEGACLIERDGRRVAYRIEDTTFTQVTSP